MSWVNKIHNGIDRLSGYASAAIVVVLMLLNSIDVIGRYFFNRPIPSTFEFSEMLLALIIFLAFPYVQFKNAHISIEILYERYPVRARQIFDLVCQGIGLAVFALIAVQGVVLLRSSMEIQELNEGKIEFSIAAFKWVVAFGTGLLALRILSQLIESIVGFLKGKGNESDSDRRA